MSSGRLVVIDDFQAVFGWQPSKSTLLRARKKKGFPAPVKLTSPQNVAYLYDEVRAWLDARIAERDGAAA